MSKRRVVTALAVVAITSPALADVRLPSIIGSNMVLQQGKAVPMIFS